MTRPDADSLLDELRRCWLNPITVVELLEHLERGKHIDPYRFVAAPRAYVVRDPAVDNGFVARVYDARTGKRVQTVHGLRGAPLADFVRAYTAAVSARRDWQLHSDFDDNQPVGPASSSGGGEGTVIPSGDGNPRRIDWIGGGVLLISQPYAVTVSEQNVFYGDLTTVLMRVTVVDDLGNPYPNATLSIAQDPTAYDVMVNNGTVSAPNWQWVQASAAFQSTSLWVKGHASTALTIPSGETRFLPLYLHASSLPSTLTGLRLKFDVFADQTAPVTPELSPDYWAAPTLSSLLPTA